MGKYFPTQRWEKNIISKNCPTCHWQILSHDNGELYLNRKCIVQKVEKYREQNEWFKYTLNIGGMDIRTDKITNKLVYNTLRDKTDKSTPTAEKKIKDLIGDVDCSLVYSMPFKITKSTMLQYFQFRINHGFLSTNSYLNKIKRIDTNLCEHCNEIDELEHYVSCKWTEALRLATLKQLHGTGVRKNKLVERRNFIWSFKSWQKVFTVKLVSSLPEILYL